jgi:hypothetical protein
MRDIVDAIRYLTHNGPGVAGAAGRLPARLDGVLLGG